jgi:hypothetical protein
MQNVEGDGVLQDMSRGGKRAKRMVVRYGEDEHDCGIWAHCVDEELDEREMEEYEDKILYLAECEGGYRDDCEVLR